VAKLTVYLHINDNQSGRFWIEAGIVGPIVGVALYLFQTCGCHGRGLVGGSYQSEDWQITLSTS
jgi:hypothetical protein